MSGEPVKKCCLTVAGSDSGGNAGVMADLRVFHDYAIHGCVALAALTAQNQFRISAIHDVPGAFLEAQLDAVLGIYDIGAMKTGMLARSEAVEIVADRLSRHREIAAVIDPVMVATSGAKLISNEAVSTLRKKLLPLARLITPNIPEAEILLGEKIDSARHQRDAAKKLSQLYSTGVLVKGGHALDDGYAEDVLCTGGDTVAFRDEAVKNPLSTHGTGCTLSAAIAAELALGRPLAEAVRGAKKYVGEAIRNGYRTGENCAVLGFSRR